MGMDGHGHGLFDDMDTDDDPFMRFSMGGHPGRMGGGTRRAFSFNPHDTSRPRGGKSRPQDPPITRDLYVTLEEVMKGVTKKMKITRNILSADGHSSRKEEKILTIDVKPGWKEGTKITFEKEGDQLPGKMPADIVFVIRDKSHPLFKREGNNLIFRAKLSLREALCGTRVTVPTLGHHKINLNLTSEIIKPQASKRIQGYGLPNPKDPSKKGDVIVQFDIQFPNNLTQSAKEILSEVLPK